MTKYVGLYISALFLLVASLLLALFAGSVQIPVMTIIRIFGFEWFGIGSLANIPDYMHKIIMDIRMPRVFLACIVGASLALSGAAFQGLLRNPLADPFTIGVSSGAALGAVSVIFFQLTFLGAFTLPLLAIVGGFVALIIVMTLARLTGRGMAVETIILAGIIVSSFIGSFISLIIALSGEELRQIVYWLMGGVGRGWSYVYLVLPFFLIGSLILLVHYRELNSMALGENAARHVGVDVNKRKGWILAGASILTGSAVSVSGTIGFVGLVMPHLVRLLSGPDHRHVLPLSMILGAAFLVVADLVARTIVEPRELPIGIITALIGAPVFAFLLVRERLGKGMMSS